MGSDLEKMPEAISATELRNNMRRIVGIVYYFGRRYLILRSGVPAAVLLSVDDYRRLTAHTDR